MQKLWKMRILSVSPARNTFYTSGISSQNNPFVYSVHRYVLRIKEAYIKRLILSKSQSGVLRWSNVSFFKLWSLILKSGHYRLILSLIFVIEEKTQKCKIKEYICYLYIIYGYLITFFNQDKLKSEINPRKYFWSFERKYRVERKLQEVKFLIFYGKSKLLDWKNFV